MSLYTRVLTELLKGPLTLPDTILVTCGGAYDIHVLRELQFRNVTISNLDDQYAEPSPPFVWSRQHAERLTFADASFDWAFVHAGLHHCASPHKALLEMLRVSRKGVVVIEARDSLLMRAAIRLGLTTEYEIGAVQGNGWIHGGVENGPVPNFVYRWTEREVRKVVESAYPHRVNAIRFFYGMREPVNGCNRPLWWIARGLQRLIPQQCNSFGFVIRHTDRLKPWMTPEFTVRRDWK